MSGHSHAKTVAATKNANDAKKGKIFSKWGRVITMAAKENGGDIATNAKLKTVIEQAKRFNMPKENIERSIKKGAGELAGESLEEVSFEGFGPGGVAIIMEGITDNKNRTLGEVKGILGQYEGKMAGEGAIRWMFERKGVILVEKKDLPAQAGDLESLAIEAGADDIRENAIYTKPEDLETVKKTLEISGLNIESAALQWVPKEEIEVSEKEKTRAHALFEALDENDAIQEIYSNMKV